jgi:predicted dehydrogenase
MSGNLPTLSRRDFLRAGATAGAALAAAPYVARARQADRTLRLAILGTGEQGRTLLQACRQIEGLSFEAVCDIWDYNRTYGERLLKRFGHPARPYEDYRELLQKEKDLDAVLIATPDFVHAEQTIAFLEAGAHVYCEKLMCNTVEGARSMVLAARRTGRLLQIGHQRRSNPRYLAARTHLLDEAKLLGRITHINGQWNRAVSEPLGFPARNRIPDEKLRQYGYTSMEAFRNWRWYRAYGGGPISDLGAHQIDMYNWFLRAQPTSVLAGGGRDFYGQEWYDNVMAIYEYPTAAGPVRAFYQVLTTTSAGGGYYEYLMGTEGSLKISENPRLTRIYREANAPEWTPWEERGWIIPGGTEGAPAAPTRRPWEKPRRGESDQAPAVVDARETAVLSSWNLGFNADKAIHQYHLENFLGAIRHGTPLNCPADDAFASTVTILKVNEAVASGRKLEFQPSDFQA